MSRLRMVMDQGDPFAFAALAKLGGAAIGAIKKFRGAGGGLVKIPTPTGPVSPGLAARTVFPGAAGVVSIIQRSAAVRAGAGGASGQFMPGQFADVRSGASSTAGQLRGIPGRRRRRMNPTNFRALQRGLRRLKAFSKLARMVLKSETKFKGPRKGGRGLFGRRRKKR